MTHTNLLLPPPTIVDQPPADMETILGSLEPEDIAHGHQQSSREISADASTAADAPSDPERERYMVALERASWNQSEAARQMGVPRATVQRAIKRLGIRVPRTSRRGGARRVRRGSYAQEERRAQMADMLHEREERSAQLERENQELRAAQTARAAEGLDQGFDLMLEFVFGALASVRGAHWAMDQEKRTAIAKPLAVGAAPLLGSAAEYMPLVIAVSGIGGHIIAALEADRRAAAHLQLSARSSLVRERPPIIVEP